MLELNDDQKKLVEDNHKLIWFVINKYHLDAEEYWDILAIALCKAAKRYKAEKKIKFSTFATHCLTMAAFGEMRKTRNKPQMVSYNEYYVDGNYNDSYLDMDVFDNDEREVIKLKVSGYTHKEISKITGINKNKIAKMIGSIKCKVGR